MPELVPISHCPNCGHQPFETHFCPQCGQKKLTENDLRISALATDFVTSLLNLDNAFFRTLSVFLTKPAQYLNEYLTGARKKYVSPIKLFLFANAFYFLFPIINTFTTSLDLQLSGQVYSSLTSSFIRPLIVSTGWDFGVFESTYNALTGTLSKVFLILLPLFFAGITRLFDISQKRAHPILLHIHYSLVLFSFALLIPLSVLPSIYYALADALGSESMYQWANNASLSFSSLLILNVYGGLLYRKLFAGKVLLNAFRLIGLNLSFFTLIILYRLFLFFLTLGWMWVFELS